MPSPDEMGKLPKMNELPYLYRRLERNCVEWLKRKGKKKVVL